MDELPQTLSFVDVETTGGSPLADRIIEIGILRVERGKLVKKYNQLINPQQHVPPFILQMTGIDPHALENAPTFYSVKDEVEELLQGSVFVAHNVRFDYGFIRAEFLRHEHTIKLPQFCTVRLFRRLFPGRAHYNLDSLIEHFQFECKHRHRAFDDAEVLWKFYRRVKKNIPKKIFLEAINDVMQRPSLPARVDPGIIDDLPETSGVYIFRDKDEVPLYIGKSVNIRARVLSHFASDLQSFELKIKQQLTRIETRSTAGELGALLLESELIKTMQPIYNRMLRNRKRMLIAKESMDADGYATVRWEQVENISTADLPTCLGVYKSERQLKDKLLLLAKEHDLCPKRLGLEHGSGVCFNYHLQRCSGACDALEPALSYNARFAQVFSDFKFKRWPFEGPIVIREKGLEASGGYILNHWCLIGKATWDSWDSMNIDEYEGTFDVDVYKILVRFLLNPKKQGIEVKLFRQTQDEAASQYFS